MTPALAVSPATNDASIASSAIQVRAFQPPDEAAWDEFVAQHPCGTPFHLIAWKRSIEETFGFRSCYLVATSGSRLCGVLPLFLVRNLIVGKALISSPFAVYGGILASDEATRQALHIAAIQTGKELRVDRIEFRNMDRQQCVGLPNVDRYVAWTQHLTSDEGELLESLPKKTRNVVRKTLKQGFVIRRHAGLQYFEDLYSSNMRRLGTPSFPHAWFKSLVRNFSQMIDVSEVWLGNKPMAASLCFLSKGDMHIYYAAADTAYNALGPNSFMYFDHLRWAGTHGFTTFDFGRCKRGTGVYDFKSHWKTVERELPYQIVPICRPDIPNFSPTNPKFELMIRVWRRLPLWLTRALGPKIVPLFP